MFKVIGLFALMCAMCAANVPVNPPAPPQVLCGYIPKELYSCAHLPPVIPYAARNKCQNLDTTCKKMTCIFRESGWIDGTTVNKAKLTEHLDRFVTDHQDWSAAIQQAKANCLGQTLLAQGYDVSCPAYDVAHCLLVQFVKNVPAAQWSSSPSCASVRQFAGSCPVCPEDCFSPAIPIGSCNACYSLPRSP